MTNDNLETITDIRLLEDGSELKLEIYNLRNPVGLKGARKGIVEKVLSLKLKRKGYPQMPPRSSSAKQSWDIPESKYWDIFRTAKNYREVTKIIEEINCTEDKKDRNIYF